MTCQGNLYNCHHCEKPDCRDIRGMIEGLVDIPILRQQEYIQRVFKLMLAKIEKLEEKKCK